MQMCVCPSTSLSFWKSFHHTPSAALTGVFFVLGRKKIKKLTELASLNVFLKHFVVVAGNSIFPVCQFFVHLCVIEKCLPTDGGCQLSF